MAEVIHDLRSLLEHERELLLDGNLEAVGQLGAAKEQCLEALGGCEDRAPLRHLADQLERNQRLLESAQAGVRAARARLALVEHVRRELNIYKADGRRAIRRSIGQLETKL
ncbi:hypothetical protein OG2516_10094 [Oceanicola granulosus HTCC2516]|uniref:FlgN protein n=1 Tax=Oceanicola granulosus (strain ATCC BAA-861 / DSM 15982 / KCTC 12143 / HTCC2516) TaxID=314256 RepID=Q2CDG5_OCEGH|nr:hypothetical protein [Oceanicola granulosus]EAR50746.1 hypothetical protein OG2516_10094 [Oceanicola granulosus HTCC2516]